jgi:hypothetical protein
MVADYAGALMNPRQLVLTALVLLTLTAAAPAVSAEPGAPEPCFFFGWCLKDDPQEAPQEFMGWLKDELTCTCPPL